MQVRKMPLALVPSDARDSRRRKYYGPTDAILFINEKFIGSSTIASREVGRFVIHLKSNKLTPTINKGQICKVELRLGDEVILSGSWVFTTSRLDGALLVLVFELPMYSALLELQKHLHPEMFFNPAGFKIFAMDNPPGLEEVSQHFTDIKEFPLPVPCTLHHGDVTFSGEFDFTSNARDLTTIDIRLTSPRSIDQDFRGPIIVDYVLFSVRYLFYSRESTLDLDFGLLTLECPKHFVALTVRRFYRLNTNILASLSFDESEEKQACEITQLSANGAEIRLLKANTAGGKQVSVSTPSLASPLKAQIIDRTASRMAVEFIRDDEPTRQGILKLLFSEIPPPLTIRKSDLYENFISLYKAVGYAPKKL